MADKVLIVDDEEGVRRVLQVSLSEVGYQVLTASEGEEAMRLVDEHHPGIILADIKMPGMDGIELLQRIKEADPDAEVIMMTGHADLELAVKSLQFEAADFITKPIHYDALEIALKRVHEKVWMRDKIREYTESLETLVSEQTQQLLQAERLAAIGQTVATLAHAIKNIIGGLSGGMFVVEKGFEKNNEEYLTEGWRMVKGNVDKIKNLTLDLLNYSKEREPDYDLCDPNIPVREVYHLMRSRAAQDQIQLRLDLAEDLGRVFLDPEAIYCSLLNLVTNAIDACAAMDAVNRPGEVMLRSRKVAGWAVEYQVRDNGGGMDEATKAKVFRSFFSTKGSKGTGLGLMIVQKIIREHGGMVELQSEPQQGTTFIVRLPKKDMTVAPLVHPDSDPDQGRNWG